LSGHSHFLFAAVLLLAGAGVSIRINDDGVDATHPDLSPNFDVSNSCVNYLPRELNVKNGHGTACAALAAASGNSECAVGMAPDATLTGCRIFASDAFDQDPTITDYLFLYTDGDTTDVSSNSYGADACYRQRRRRLQTVSCPFSTTYDDSPCGSKSACADADWGDTLSADCEADIVRYCRSNYGIDVAACVSFLDLFVDCEYNAQSAEELAAMTKGITEGRGGLGIVYVYAAGNEFELGEDTNFEGSLNSRFTMRYVAIFYPILHVCKTSSLTFTLISVLAPSGRTAYMRVTRHLGHRYLSRHREVICSRIRIILLLLPVVDVAMRRLEPHFQLPSQLVSLL